MLLLFRSCVETLPRNKQLQAAVAVRVPAAPRGHGHPIPRGVCAMVLCVFLLRSASRVKTSIETGCRLSRPCESSVLRTKRLSQL